MLQKLRPAVTTATDKPASWFVQHNVTATQVTLTGLLLCPLAVFFVLTHHAILAALIVVLIAAIDVIDGAVARKTKPTKQGAFLDSVIDRVVDGALLAAIALSTTSTLIRATAILALLAAQLVSYTRARAEALNLQVANGPGERAERLILLLAGLVVPVLLLPALAAMTLLALYTAVLRTVEAIRPPRHATPRHLRTKALSWEYYRKSLLQSYWATPRSTSEKRTASSHATRRRRQPARAWRRVEKNRPTTPQKSPLRERLRTKALRADDKSPQSAPRAAD